MKDDLPGRRENQSDRVRSQRERALNSERMDEKHPLKLKHRVIVGIVLGSFFFLVVGCWYWVGLDKPKSHRTDFNFRHHPGTTTP